MSPAVWVRQTSVPTKYLVLGPEQINSSGRVLSPKHLIVVSIPIQVFLSPDLSVQVLHTNKALSWGVNNYKMEYLELSVTVLIEEAHGERRVKLCLVSSPLKFFVDMHSLISAGFLGVLWGTKTTAHVKDEA